MGWWCFTLVFLLEILYGPDFFLWLGLFPWLLSSVWYSSAIIVVSYSCMKFEDSVCSSVCFLLSFSTFVRLKCCWLPLFYVDYYFFCRFTTVIISSPQKPYCSRSLSLNCILLAILGQFLVGCFWTSVCFPNVICKFSPYFSSKIFVFLLGNVLRVYIWSVSVLRRHNCLISCINRFKCFSLSLYCLLSVASSTWCLKECLKILKMYLLFVGQSTC